MKTDILCSSPGLDSKALDMQDECVRFHTSPETSACTPHTTMKHTDTGLQDCVLCAEADHMSFKIAWNTRSETSNACMCLKRVALVEPETVSRQMFRTRYVGLNRSHSHVNGGVDQTLMPCSTLRDLTERDRTLDQRVLRRRMFSCSSCSRSAHGTVSANPETRTLFQPYVMCMCASPPLFWQPLRRPANAS